MPLVAKPVAGRGGHGVVVLRDPAEAARHLDALYGADPAATLLVQAAERFVAEYRVMVCFGAVLGVARKLPREGAVAANAAQGGVFAPAERPDVAAFVAAHADPVGILGVDVGEVDDGSLRLIEANRAPQWQAFDAALGIDTAREIVRHARQRLADPVHVPAGPERA